MRITLITFLISGLMLFITPSMNAAPVTSSNATQNQQVRPAKQGFMTKIITRWLQRKVKKQQKRAALSPTDTDNRPSREARIILGLGVGAIAGLLLPLLVPPISILIGISFYLAILSAFIIGLMAVVRRRKLRRSGKVQNEVSRKFIKIGFIMGLVAAIPALLFFLALGLTLVIILAIGIV